MGDNARISKVLSDGFHVLLRLLRTPYTLLRCLKQRASPSFCLTALPTQGVQQLHGRTITAHSLGPVNLEGYGALLSGLRTCAVPPDLDSLRLMAEQLKHTGHFDLACYARMFADSVSADATFAHVCVAQDREAVAALLLSNSPR
jgi:hypothetical protein